jgi:hypothetical protein
MDLNVRCYSCLDLPFLNVVVDFCRGTCWSVCNSNGSNFVEAVFECRHCLLQYGDILLEGWRNLVVCLAAANVTICVEAVFECRRCLF